MISKAVSVFFSYSHKDESLRDELAKHLSILQRHGVISSWHDRKILPGEEWDHQINENLKKADIILLLISSDFIASNYCWDVEVTTAMERYEKREAEVIPIILRDVDWKGAPFGKLQFLPKNADPVTSWTNKDAAFKNVAQGIRLTAEELINKRQQEQAKTIKQAAINEYRKKVEELADDGEISYVGSVVLQDLQEELGLTDEEAEQIQQEVLAPIKEYQKKCDRYRQTFQDLVNQKGLPLPTKEKNDLQKLWEHFKLKPGDVTQIETEIINSIPPKPPTPPTPPTPPKPEIELKSERGMDYRGLRDFLAANNWKKADEETTNLMLKVANRESEGWLRIEDIDNFPCEDLRTINQLWIYYSNGKFGFSVQKEIYQRLGGTRESNEKVWQKFGDTIEWRVNNSWIDYKDVTFDISAPQGHLPRVGWKSGRVCGPWGSLLSRRDL